MPCKLNINPQTLYRRRSRKKTVCLLVCLTVCLADVSAAKLSLLFTRR